MARQGRYGAYSQLFRCRAPAFKSAKLHNRKGGSYSVPVVYNLTYAAEAFKR